MTTFDIQRARDSGSEIQDQSEMRLSTVMMADVVASTEMSEKLGPEASFLLLSKVLHLTRSIVSAHGGTIINELGDGIVVLFGAPISIDRASLAACRAGLEICDAVRNASESFLSSFGHVPEIRVGLAAGEVLLGGRKDTGTLDVTGHDVNLAARLQAIAEPNCVVCSKSVAMETDGWTRLEALGARSLKGFSKPIEVYNLLGIATGDLDPMAGSGRHIRDFVGRTTQLTQLMGWINKAENEHPFALIVGEAGIGKSRVLSEFATRLGNRRPVLGACHPMTVARPLAPLVDLFRAFANWRPGLTEAQMSDALGPLLPARPIECVALAKLIADQGQPDAGSKTWDAVVLRRALIEALSALGQREDVLVAVEDLHWIDPLSGDILLEVVAASTGQFRMLGTTRPVDWLEQLPEGQIEIVQAGPLQAAEIGMIGKTFMGSAVTDEIIAKVMRSSEGNPFFAIEIMQSFIAQDGGLDAGRIGPIQNIALARFDRLDHETKALLRMASVQGRSFRFDVLATAASGTSLATDDFLQATEGVVERDPQDTEGSGRFRHILFRDSIYATIPSMALGSMHLATARASEACANHRAEIAADTLAYHYERAGENVQAVRFLRAAARNAYGLYALETCRIIMERAFRLIEADIENFDQDALEDAVIILVRCLDVLDQFRAVLALTDTWLPRLRTSEGSSHQAMLLALTSKAQCHMGNVVQGHQQACEALDFATRLDDESAATYAKVVMMRTLLDTGLGPLEKIEELFEETREFCETLSDATLYANRMFHMMMAYRVMGRMRKACEINDVIHNFAEQHDQPHISLLSDWNRCLNANYLGDFTTCLPIAKDGLKRSGRNTAVRELFLIFGLAAKINLGMDVEVDQIDRVIVSSDERGEFTTRIGATVQAGFTRLIKGQLRQGWRQLGLCEVQLGTAGFPEARRMTPLLKAEFLLVIGGYIPLDLPPPKLAPLDLALAIYLRLNAKRLAKSALSDFMFQFGHEDGFLVGRAQVCLAVLAASEGKTDDACQRFDIAERLLNADAGNFDIKRLQDLRNATGL